MLLEAAGFQSGGGGGARGGADEAGAGSSEEPQALLLRAVEGGTLETVEWGPEVTLLYDGGYYP